MDSSSITTQLTDIEDAGISTLTYFALLILFFRQVARSRSVTGLSRVSRYPFLIQSLIDAVAFVGVCLLSLTLP